MVSGDHQMLDSWPVGFLGSSSHVLPCAMRSASPIQCDGDNCVPFRATLDLPAGRVSMLAAVGFVVGEQLEDFPAFLNFDGSVTGPAITHFQQIKTGFWETLVLFIGVAEAYRVAVGWATPVGNQFNKLKEDYEPGTLG